MTRKLNLWTWNILSLLKLDYLILVSSQYPRYDRHPLLHHWSRIASVLYETKRIFNFNFILKRPVQDPSCWEVIPIIRFFWWSRQRESQAYDVGWWCECHYGYDCFGGKMLCMLTIYVMVAYNYQTLNNINEENLLLTSTANHSPLGKLEYNPTEPPPISYRNPDHAYLKINIDRKSSSLVISEIVSNVSMQQICRRGQECRWTRESKRYHESTGGAICCNISRLCSPHHDQQWSHDAQGSSGITSQARICCSL